MGRTIPTTEKVFRGLMSREKKKEALALQRELDQVRRSLCFTYKGSFFLTDNKIAQRRKYCLDGEIVK